MVTAVSPWPELPTITLSPRQPRLLGADLMELSPPHDENARTAKLAARLLLEVLSARG